MQNNNTRAEGGFNDPTLGYRVFSGEIDRITAATGRNQNANFSHVSHGASSILT